MTDAIAFTLLKDTAPTVEHCGFKHRIRYAVPPQKILSPNCVAISHRKAVFHQDCLETNYISNSSDILVLLNVPLCAQRQNSGKTPCSYIFFH